MHRHHRRVLINVLRMEITHVQPPFDALRSRTRKHVLTSRLRPCTVSLLDQCLPSSSVFVIQNRWLEVVSLLSSELASLPAPIFRYCTRSWFRRYCSLVPWDQVFNGSWEQLGSRHSTISAYFIDNLTEFLSAFRFPINSRRWIDSLSLLSILNLFFKRNKNARVEFLILIH